MRMWRWRRAALKGVTEDEAERRRGGGRQERREFTHKSSLFIISYISAFNVCSSADLLSHLCLWGELTWPTLQVLSRSVLRSREYTHESVRIRSEQDP